MFIDIFFEKSDSFDPHFKLHFKLIWGMVLSKNFPPYAYPIVSAPLNYYSLPCEKPTDHVCMDISLDSPFAPYRVEYGRFKVSLQKSGTQSSKCLSVLFCFFKLVWLFWVPGISI